jgi:polyphosphate kinase
MTPIEEPALAHKIEQILLIQIQDNQLRWELQSNGQYKKITTKDRAINNHEILENYATKMYNKSRKSTPEYVNKLSNQILKEK